MFVLDDGTLRILNMFIGAGVNFENFSINGTPITLIAQRRSDNSWKIEKIGGAGDAGTLDVIVTDSTGTKNEFSLTESFSRDFPLDLDPEDWELEVLIINKTHHDLSVRFTVLLDGEVVHDQYRFFQSGASQAWSQARSITNE